MHASHALADHQRQLAALNPVFRVRVEGVLAELSSKGWMPVVHSGVRSEKEQAELAKRGVGGTTSWHVAGHHQSRWVSGLGFTVRGYAADIIDRRYGWGGPAANHTFGFWTDLGVAAKRQGLEWGGAWTKGQHPGDVAHIQMKLYEFSQDMRGQRA